VVVELARQKIFGRRDTGRDGIPKHDGGVGSKGAFGGINERLGCELGSLGTHEFMNAKTVVVEEL
jgi:hypothetical protein